MESPDLLSEVRAGLKAIGSKAWPDIERVTGKSIHTIRKIAYGDRRNPELATIEPIAKYLRERQ